MGEVIDLAAERRKRRRASPGWFEIVAGRGVKVRVTSSTWGTAPAGGLTPEVLRKNFDAIWKRPR